MNSTIRTPEQLFFFVSGLFWDVTHSFHNNNTNQQQQQVKTQQIIPTTHPQSTILSPECLHQKQIIHLIMLVLILIPLMPLVLVRRMINVYQNNKWRTIIYKVVASVVVKIDPIHMN
jgi:hypothetical protein